MQKKKNCNPQKKKPWHEIFCIHQEYLLHIFPACICSAFLSHMLHLFLFLLPMCRSWWFVCICFQVSVPLCVHTCTLHKCHPQSALVHFCFFQSCPRVTVCCLSELAKTKSFPFDIPTSRYVCLVLNCTSTLIGLIYHLWVRSYPIQTACRNRKR